MKHLGLTALLFVLLAALPFAQAPASPVIGEWDLTTVSPVGEKIGRAHV